MGAEAGGALLVSAVEEEEVVGLIPCLPDEIAMECLVRIPHKHHSAMKLVCHGWRSLFSDPRLFSERRRLGYAEHLIFLVQPAAAAAASASSPPPQSQSSGVSEKCLQQQPPQGEEEEQALYSLGVYNLTRNEWHRVSMSSLLRIPLFCQAAGVPGTGKVVLVGGWDPETLEPVSDAYVIDLVAGTWKRGSSMRTARSFFACAVVGGKVWVAGGHDGHKNALRSAEVYDVAEDRWEVAPEMAEERDECYGVVSRGSKDFLVVSGYGTESQGRFRSDAEWFDPEANRWVKVQGVWPFEGISPRSSVVGAGEDRRWWCFAGGGGGEVKEFNWEEKRWFRVSGEKIDMPSGLIGSDDSFSLCAVDLGETWFVMGNNSNTNNNNSNDEEEEKERVLPVYVVEKQGTVWKQVEPPPPAFLGFPFSASHVLT